MDEEVLQPFIEEYGFVAKGFIPKHSKWVSSVIKEL